MYARHRLYLSLVDVALALLGCIRAGRRDELEPEILVAGFAAVLAVNAMNPDALIARPNIERARHGEELDASYLTTLSADAVPVLIEALLRIGDHHVGQGYTLERAVLDRWPRNHTDRRTWNLSRSTAHRLVESRVESSPNVNSR